jgi:hypothetical protein
MNFVQWSKSSVDYGRKLVDSAVEGARSGEREFLQEESLGPLVGESAQHALCPAVIGACLGAAGGYLWNGRRSKTTSAVCAFLGGAIGLGAGVIWDSRHFTASVASGAWKNIGKTRDEHWFEKNPIDYA